MTNDGTAKDDVKVPEGDLGKQISDDFEAGKDLLVTIISAMGEEQVWPISFADILPFERRLISILVLTSGYLLQGSPEGILNFPLHVGKIVSWSHLNVLVPAPLCMRVRGFLGGV